MSILKLAVQQGSDQVMDNIRIRTANVEDRFALARISVDATYSAFRGIVPDSVIESLTVEESAANWARSLREKEDADFFVAEVERLDVIGLAMIGAVRSDNLTSTEVPKGVHREIYSLHVDPAWHRRSIGTMLVNHARELGHQGNSGMLVKVLSVNPNVAFYEKLGAVRIGTEPYDWEGFKTKELVYAWTD